VPDAGVVVEARSDKTPAVGAEANRRQRCLVTPQDTLDSTRPDVEDATHSVRRGSREPPPVGAKGKSSHRAALRYEHARARAVRPLLREPRAGRAQARPPRSAPV